MLLEHAILGQECRQFSEIFRSASTSTYLDITALTTPALQRRSTSCAPPVGERIPAIRALVSMKTFQFLRVISFFVVTVPLPV